MPITRIKQLPITILLGVFFMECICYALECQYDCICTGYTVKCTGEQLPSFIPKTTTHVYLEGFSLNNLDYGVFKKPIWKNITSLSIKANVGVTLQGQCFVGLDSLQHLTLHGKQLSELELLTFQGLDKLISLDLSENDKLNAYHIQRAFSSANILSTLQNLILAELQSRAVIAIEINYPFLSALTSGRNLQYLDMTNTNIHVADFKSLSNTICKSVKHLILRNIVLTVPLTVKFIGGCESIEILDLTDTLFPFRQLDLSFVQCNLGWNILKNVKHVILNNALSKISIADFHNKNYSVCEFKFNTFEMRRNNFKVLNVSARVPASFRLSLKSADLSDNILEYILPEMINIFDNLEKVNLTKNRLHVMQTAHPEHFQNLFRSSTSLKELGIAENQLTDLPFIFFEKACNLRLIDISRNMITHISFNISCMNNLELIDLRNNWIHTIDKQTTHLLDHINLERKSQTVYNDSNSMQVKMFRVNLASNPLVCDCTEESKTFLQWYEISETISRDTNETHVCKFQDDQINMGTNILHKVQSLCDHRMYLERLKIVLPILLSVVLIIIVLLVVICRRYRRQASEHRRRETLVHEFIEGCFKEDFLVFLSFCSEDSDFATNKLYPELETCLCALVNCQRKLICVGDREFHLGKLIHSEVSRCVEKSSVIIFVVSNMFCAKEWCRMEVNEAHEQNKPIILLMKEHVDLTKMTPALRRIFDRYTRVMWVQDCADGHLEPGFNELADSVLHLASKDI